MKQALVVVIIIALFGDQDGKYIPQKVILNTEGVESNIHQDTTLLIFSRMFEDSVIMELNDSTLFNRRFKKVVEYGETRLPIILVNGSFKNEDSLKLIFSDRMVHTYLKPNDKYQYVRFHVYNDYCLQSFSNSKNQRE